MSDGRWLAAAALLALAGVARARGSRGIARSARVVTPKLVVRYTHKISPRDTDVEAPVPLPRPESLFLDAECKAVDVAAVRALWKRLHPTLPLGRMSEVRVEKRNPEKPVRILLFNPSLWSTAHAIVLEIHDWEQHGSRSTYGGRVPSSSLSPLSSLRGSRGVARSSRQRESLKKYTYTVTYEEIDSDGDEEESGYIVDGWDTPLPEGLYGEAAVRWREENEVDQELEPADEDDLMREAAHVDVEEIDLSVVPEGLLKAVAFGRLVRDAGATDDSGSNWWSTSPHQDTRTGGWRTESYHPSRPMFQEYGGLIRAVIRNERAAVREWLMKAGVLS